MKSQDVKIIFQKRRNKLGKVDRAIEKIMREKSELEKKIRILEKMEPYQDSIPECIILDTLTNKILLRGLRTIKDFKDTIKWLKECYGNIKYKQRSIFYNDSSKDVTCTWEVEDFIEIWLSTKPEDFPKELQSEDCGIVELEPRTERRYTYVCKNKN